MELPGLATVASEGGKFDPKEEKGRLLELATTLGPPAYPSKPAGPIELLTRKCLPFIKPHSSAILALSETAPQRPVSAGPIHTTTPRPPKPHACPTSLRPCTLSCRPCTSPALLCTQLFSTLQRCPPLRRCRAARAPTCRNLRSPRLSPLIGRHSHVTDALSDPGLLLVDSCLAEVHLAVRLQD